jgi:hypothetical protein
MIFSTGVAKAKPVRNPLKAAPQAAIVSWKRKSRRFISFSSLAKALWLQRWGRKYQKSTHFPLRSQSP